MNTQTHLHTETQEVHSGTQTHVAYQLAYVWRQPVV